MKKRLDVLLFDKKLTKSRKTASDLIKDKKVSVGGVIVDKPSKEVEEESVVSISELPKYVSRAGLKLEHALKEFKVEVSNKVCLDVGSSTGGFTDCLLKNGAKKIYAVDVGTGQLDVELKNNEKVISLEKTDIRSIEKLLEKIDLAVIDVSFISLDLILPAVIKLLKKGGEVIALVKPQFEVGKDNLGKGGIVKTEELRMGVLEKIKNISVELGLKVKGQTKSPIEGGDGNVEYLLYFCD